MKLSTRVASNYLKNLYIETETPAQRVVRAFLNQQQEILREASKAEKEVERLFLKLLPGTPFANKTHAVGGYVRDEYINMIEEKKKKLPKWLRKTLHFLKIMKKDPLLDPHDLDIVIEMDGGSKKLTHYIKEEFGDAVSTPIQMGNYPIWEVVFKDDVEFKGKKYKTRGAEIQVADTMEEEFPEEGSRQREVKYAPLKKDIERRDFTVNMLLKDLTTGEIKDLTGMSKKDIEKGVLKHINDNMLDQRFKEDPLRLIRLARFAAIKGWDIPKHVLRIAKNNAKRIKIVPTERIHDELVKTMKTADLAKAIRIMGTIGVRKYIMKEIDALKGVEHDKRHHQEGDVYKHTLKVLQNAKPGIVNQMAALLHDVGKPATQERLQDKITFYDHQDAGAEIARAVMNRLKFDKKTTSKVVKLVQRHMDPLKSGLIPPEKPSKDAPAKDQRKYDKKRRKFEERLRAYLRKMGPEMTDSIMDLARADELGRLPPKEEIPTLRKEIEKIRKSPIKVEEKPPLDSREIMELLNLKPGPEVKDAKEIMERIQDQAAVKGKRLTKEEAKKELRERWKNKMKTKKQKKV